MWLLISSLGCFLLQVFGQYYMTGDAVDRVAAIQKCTTLARPNITFTKTENTVDLDVESLSNGQRAWVGYTMTAEIFHYIGCLRISDFKDNINHTRINTTHDPGQCYSACKTSTTFGLRATEWRDCFCFNTDVGNQVYDTRNKCNSACDNTLFACGDSGFLSLYTKAQIETDKSNSSKCLGYSEQNGRYDWLDCSDERKAVCFKDENDTEPLKKRNNAWEDAMDSCFHSDEYPISSRNDPNSPTDYDYWTAYINTLVISDLDGPNTGVYEYGYIERKDNDIFLKFTNDPNDSMAALCETEPTTSTTTSTTTTSPTTTTATTTTTSTTTTTTTTTTFKPSRTSITSEVTMAITDQTSSSNPANKANPIPQTQSSEKEKTAVYVAVPLVILACVGVAVVVVVVCYRRRHKPEESECPVLPRSNVTYNYCDDQLSDVDVTGGDSGYVNTAFENSANTKKERDETKTRAQTSYDEVDIQTPSMSNGYETGLYDYAQEDQDDTQLSPVPANTYFLLEKLEKDPETCSENYTNDTDTYESEANGNKISRSDNIYNTANYNTDGDDYDHIGRMNISAKDDGTYDTTAKVMRPNDDSDYDTTNVSSSRNGRRDEVKTTDSGHYDTTTGVTRANGDYDTTNLSSSRNGRKDGTGQTDVQNNYGYANKKYETEKLYVNADLNDV